MIVVSIVSHGHGELVSRVVRSVIKFEQVKKVILTLNIPEELPIPKSEKIEIIRNQKKKGFSENHNHAFQFCSEPYFCVLNPDIEFLDNPFPKLFSLLEDYGDGVCAPIVNSGSGDTEVTWREFPTPVIILKKLMKKKFNLVEYTVDEDADNYVHEPDWVAGMFMMFNSNVYSHVGGFDESYFLYYEDVDICFRLKQLGYSVVGSREVKVLHHAQRDSHKKLLYFSWHIKGMMRFFLRRLTA